MTSNETRDREMLFDLMLKIKRSIQELLEINTILGSSYIAVIEKTVDDVEKELFDDRRPKMMAALPPRFANVYCSQCGSDFGPGDNGYSSCDDHSVTRVK